MSNPEIKHIFKFIIIGSSGVGKSSLVSQLLEGTFSQDNLSTVGVEFFSRKMDIEGTVVKLQIWDTAGQEKFRSVAKSYFRHAVGVIMVFDITDRKSFDDLSLWLNDVHTLCDSNAAITLIGNKTDLESQRAVTTTEATSYANTHQLQYLETSAKGGDNVQEAFYRAAKSVFDRAEKGQLSSKTNNAGSMPVPQPQGGCSC